MADTKEVRISGEKFELRTPFKAGDVIDEATARQLNQVRLENIGNNYRKRIDEAVEARDNGDPSKWNEVVAALAQYDAEYTFAMPGTGTRVVRDPVEREARSIARDHIKLKLAAQGRKFKDVDPDKLEAEIDRFASMDATIKLAKKRVAEKAKALDALGDELGDLGSAPAEAAPAA